MAEAGEILGCSERQFRRYRDRHEEEGLAGLADKRLGKASARRVPVDEIAWMLDQYRTEYRGWNVKHFHEQLVKHHGFGWGYTWTKTQLHTASATDRPMDGARRAKFNEPRRPFGRMSGKSAAAPPAGPWLRSACPASRETVGASRRRIPPSTRSRRAQGGAAKSRRHNPHCRWQTGKCRQA
ncbi:MAG: helix-turn-helix domain-containing protein [Hyphomicrobiales bacterium]|nr:helix-turn-helix domain-containing protein [Hyphomicrobiales bacterium]